MPVKKLRFSFFVTPPPHGTRTVAGSLQGLLPLGLQARTSAQIFWPLGWAVRLKLLLVLVSVKGQVLCEAQGEAVFYRLPKSKREAVNRKLRA